MVVDVGRILVSVDTNLRFAARGVLCNHPCSTAYTVRVHSTEWTARRVGERAAVRPLGCAAVPCRAFHSLEEGVGARRTHLPRRGGRRVTGGCRKGACGLRVGQRGQRKSQQHRRLHRFRLRRFS